MQNKLSKEIGTMIKDALILCLITVVAGCLLGMTNEVTKEPIEKQKMAAALEAYKAVSPQATDFGYNDDLLASAKNELLGMLEAAGKDYGNTEITVVVEARDSNKEVIGYVFSVLSKDGYGGDINICVGTSLDGTITGIEIVEHGETPGLGMRATEPEFRDQYKDKQVDEFILTKSGKQADNEIDALSGATVTSRAVTNSVNVALFFVKNCINQS